MADLGITALKAEVNENITTNGEQQITGAILNDALIDTIDTLQKAATVHDGLYWNGQAGDVVAKTISANDFILTPGGSIKVRFENANTAASATLNVNGTGAHLIVFNGGLTTETNTWGANEIIEFTYNNYNAGTWEARVWRLEKVSVSQKTLTIGSNEYPFNVSSKTIVVAAYDSSDDAKAGADIVANSEGSGITAINTAIASLIDGGRVYLRQGTYGGTNYVDISVSNILIEGESYNTYIKRTGTYADIPVIVASGVVNSFVETVKFDYKPASVHYRNIMFGGGIASEFSENLITVAASDSTQHTKDNAAYVCNGTNDREVIQNALSNLPSTGGTVKLCAGTYTLDAVIAFTKSNSALIGDFGATKIEYTSGFSGTVALRTQNSSNNCTVVGIDFGAKSLNLEYSGNGFAYQCTYLSSYHTFSKLEGKIGLNPYTYLIAASDAPDKVKVLADYICDGTDDNVEINNAITILRNAGKTGVIQLSTGNFNFGSGVIQITTSGIELRGCGYATVINRTNPLALEVLNSSNNIIVRGINFGNHTLDVKGSNYLAYVYDCWVKGSFYHEYTHNNNIAYVEPAQGIAGINSAISSFGSNGGTIILNEGTYEGTAGIEMNKPNIIIEGKGYKTVIKRSSGNDIFGDPGAENSIIRNVRFYNQFQQNGSYPTQRYRIENCWNKGTLINQCEPSNVIVNIGSSYFFKKISTPYSMVTGSNWYYNNRFEFHIHGHILQDTELWCDKPIVLIGHNALVEFNGVGANRATFDIIPPSYVSNMDGWSPVLVKDIHFIKTGCFNYWNNVCVAVFGADWKFVNCVFENASSSPSPFDNSTQEVGAEDHNGCRRHGVSVTISTYGQNCKTEFHNCIGIGSPYGFQSSRGWYFMAGSPKLFNCIGYGGGIGEFGHGMISHEASDAQLFNCVAYAGEHTYRQGAGFRYQAHGKNNLFGCVGYGSKGTQRKSEGVPYATLHSKCTSLGITDESFFYDGTDVDYDGLTIKTTDDGYNASRMLLGNALTPSDIVFTELGGVSEAGYGISLWNHNGLPIIENCKGFAGHGINSAGLKIQANSKPNVKGGFFGQELQMFKNNISKNSGAYTTFKVPTDLLSQYTPYTLKGVGVTIGGGTYANRHLLLYLETDESTPQVIINGYDMYGQTAIGQPEISSVQIPANVGLKAYIKENGSVVSDYNANYFFLMITFAATPTNAAGIMIEGSAAPKIKDSIIEHNSIGLGIYTTSADYLIDNCKIVSDGDAIDTDKTGLRVFDSAVKGTVDNSITFAQKSAVNNSSNYSV